MNTIPAKPLQSSIFFVNNFSSTNSESKIIFSGWFWIGSASQLQYNPNTGLVSKLIDTLLLLSLLRKFCCRKDLTGAEFAGRRVRL